MLVEVMTATEARDLIRYCLTDGEIVPSGHFRTELAAEGLTLVDVWHVLRTGCIYEASERDIKTGEWKYRIEGTEPDEGRWIGVVFSFKTIERVCLITVFTIESRRRV